MTQETRGTDYPIYISNNELLYNAILFQKMEQVEKKLDYLLEKDQTEFHSVEWRMEDFKRFAPKGNIFNDNMENSGAKWRQEQQTCNEILDRANSILREWAKTSDIRIQIQYATIIIKKIENLKKLEYIAENEAGKKMCTLLRNTIKLNSDKELFSSEQIDLIQNGLKKAVLADVTKEDMLQMNRQLHKAGLRTMPAWE